MVDSRQWKVHILDVQPYRISFHLFNSTRVVWILDIQLDVKLSKFFNWKLGSAQNIIFWYFVFAFGFEEQKTSTSKKSRRSRSVASVWWQRMGSGMLFTLFRRRDVRTVNMEWSAREHNNGLYESLWVDTIICQTVHQECLPGMDHAPIHLHYKQNIYLYKEG